MDGNMLILAAATVVSILLLIAAIRQRRYQKQMTNLFDQTVGQQKLNDEGIIGKRIIGVNSNESQHHVSSSHETKKNDNLIIFHLMATNGHNFSAYHLYQTLHDAGFKLNEYGVFEYSEIIDDQRSSLFSLASVIQPGTFNPNDINSFACPGLSIFMGLNQPTVAHAFKVMMKKVEYLVEILQAEVLDNQNRKCTEQYFNQCRAKVTKASESLIQKSYS